MYGHAIALLPKCSTHPTVPAVVVDDHSDRLMCAECARPMFASVAHRGALHTIA